MSPAEGAKEVAVAGLRTPTKYKKSFPQTWIVSSNPPTPVQGVVPIPNFPRITFEASFGENESDTAGGRESAIDVSSSTSSPLEVMPPDATVHHYVPRPLEKSDFSSLPVRQQVDPPEAEETVDAPVPAKDVNAASTTAQFSIPRKMLPKQSEKMVLADPESEKAKHLSRLKRMFMPASKESPRPSMEPRASTTPFFKIPLLRKPLSSPRARTRFNTGNVPVNRGDPMKAPQTRTQESSPPKQTSRSSDPLPATILFQRRPSEAKQRCQTSPYSALSSDLGDAPAKVPFAASGYSPSAFPHQYSPNGDNAHVVATQKFSSTYSPSYVNEPYLTHIVPF